MATETQPSSRNILIAGDFVLDHHIYEGRRYHSFSEGCMGFRESRSDWHEEKLAGQNEDWLKPENDQEFDKLPEFIKESNRAATGRMLEILSLLRLRLEKGTASDEEEMVRARL